MSALIQAAAEFLGDERRRATRGHRRRLAPSDLGALSRNVRALTEGRSAPGDTPEKAAERGLAAVELFGYVDTFDEKAASVITDILHAMAAKGWDPQMALERAAMYYAEEMSR